MNRSGRAAIAAMALCAPGYLAPAAHAAKETVLYSFQNNGADGYFPTTSLTVANGKLYGTTPSGGTGRCVDGCGTIFSVDPATGTETVLHSFEGKETGGVEPGSLLLAGDKLFGTTAAGGRRDYGMIFSLDLGSGDFESLYSFCNLYECGDGSQPTAGLLDWKGVLYGTTEYGGEIDGGVAFSFNTKTNAETGFYSFPLNLDPQGGSIRLRRKLYGMTMYGGAGCYGIGSTCGSVFSLDLTNGKQKILYSFCSQEDCSDGAYPQGGLIDYDGTFYGVTQKGGVNTNCVGTITGCGVVFSLDPVTGVETVLHAFQPGVVDGQKPDTGLVEANGQLYGTTPIGGKNYDGIVYSVDPVAGAETVVYPFCRRSGCQDGSTPESALVSLNGVLYGTTSKGGTGDCPGGCGTVFAITP